MSPHRAYVFFFLSLCCTSLFGGARPAHAQDSGPPPEYRGLVDSALAEFEAEHWAEARALFEHAHSIFPNARTLRGIGMAAFELRDYVAARRALESSIADDRRPLTDEQRAQVTELLGRTRVFVGDFTVGPAPTGTELAVDGVPTTPEGDLATSATVALAAGAHELSLRAPDGRTAHAQVTVHGGEYGALALAIIDAIAAAEDERAQDEAPPHPPPPPRAPRDLTGPWALTLGGAGAVLLGAVLVGVGASDAATVSGAARGTEWADLDAAYGRAQPLEIGGAIALAVGAAALFGGLAWMLLPEDGDARVAVEIGPGSLQLRGSF